MTDYSYTQWFGSNLAGILSEKLLEKFPEFPAEDYIQSVEAQCAGMSYTERVVLHATELRMRLPRDYEKAVSLLVSILGPENPKETGMFKHFYWVLPIGKFVELYGLEHLEISLEAIGEITRRNTGEYAIRPYIQQDPDRLIRQMTAWSLSDNFHLRRLASEGLRPKLPWAKKLDLFIDDPTPVFEILSLLKEDPIKFVQKSVANHLTDYLKVNPVPTYELLREWNESDHAATAWIVKRATRKFPL